MFLIEGLSTQVIAGILESNFPISGEFTELVAGSVAVATILSIAYLLQVVIRLIEVSRQTDN